LVVQSVFIGVSSFIFVIVCARINYKKEAPFFNYVCEKCGLGAGGSSNKDYSSNIIYTRFDFHDEYHKLIDLYPFEVELGFTYNYDILSGEEFLEDNFVYIFDDILLSAAGFISAPMWRYE
jgi:hypothetical protein